MPIKLVSIDGNIGSGKSTLLEHLKQQYKDYDNVLFANEPVSEWDKITDENGTTMLQKFYMDQNKYAFSFQMMAYMSRLSIFRKLNKEAGDKNIIVITERSLLTDKHVFAQMLYDQGKIEEVNYKIYLSWFYEFSADFPVHHCVYIKTDPEICHDRIQKRSRVGEDVIPLAYLTKCHEYHNEYVSLFNSLLTFDGNNDIYKSPCVLHEWVDKINNILFE